MNIAIIGDDSLPTSTLVHAKMLHELAVEFKKTGHTAILISPGTPHQSNPIDKDVIDGIDYWNFRSGWLRGKGKLNRAINETLMSFRAWSAIKPELKHSNFDLIVYYSPSIFFGPFVKKLKKQCNAKTYLVLRDMFPQWAVDEGLIRKGSFIEKYFRYFEKLNYSVADKIGLMSPKNKVIFDSNTDHLYPTEVLYNWAALTPIDLPSFKLREKLDLEGKIIFFYGGNIGHAQDMGNLLRLAKSMLRIENSHFILLGQGDEVNLVQSTILNEKLTNTSFLSSVTQDEYKAILQEIDIGLFSLAASHKSHNFPGKLLGYMHTSLPVLGSVNVGNDLIEIINEHKAGFVSVNGDDVSFLKAAKELCDNYQLRTEIGNNGRLLLKDMFSVESAAKNILNEWN
jgi:glycosyltransferase involved in cell wall biosynthesis